MFIKQNVKHHQYLGEDTIKQDKLVQSANVNLSLVAEQDHISLVIEQECYFGVESAAMQCSGSVPRCQ